MIGPAAMTSQRQTAPGRDREALSPETILPGTVTPDHGAREAGGKYQSRGVLPANRRTELARFDITYPSETVESTLADMPHTGTSRTGGSFHHHTQIVPA